MIRTMDGVQDLVVELTKEGPGVRLVLAFETDEQAKAAFEVIKDGAVNAPDGIFTLKLHVGAEIKEH